MPALVRRAIGSMAEFLLIRARQKCCCCWWLLDLASLFVMAPDIHPLHPWLVVLPSTYHTDLTLSFAVRETGTTGPVQLSAML
jgi:hypothetical protein